ncbi:protein of unknown function [Moritella yayanosii]|uniref:Uncharacterized protein n=1 Tax=Moritella yayanosii TaxID=69539 RepID=A0A330LJ71_9GAMM|nr:protein of unknown function [Moritella yayanosii]
MEPSVNTIALALQMTLLPHCILAENEGLSKIPDIFLYQIM